MPKNISPELYDKYKVKVLEMSAAIQCYKGTTVERDASSLTDQEIAERLNLDVEEVTEIRCIAELDLIPSETWIESANWKREKARKALGRR